jgi:hypothetical protein
VVSSCLTPELRCEQAKYDARSRPDPVPELVGERPIEATRNSENRSQLPRSLGRLVPMLDVFAARAGRSPAARRPIGSRPVQHAHRHSDRPRSRRRRRRAELALEGVVEAMGSRESRDATGAVDKYTSSLLQLCPQLVEEALHHHERRRPRHVSPTVVSHHEEPLIIRRDRKGAPDQRSRADSVWYRE